MPLRPYDGPVCYRDGWHWTVGGDGEPGKKLYLDDETGVYRAAAATDESWHDRHHQQFVTAELT